jgi:hypothetical protein
MSPRGYLEAGVGASLIGVIVWLLLSTASLKVQLADQKTKVQTAQLKVQAAETSYQSARIALAASDRAVATLSEGSRSAWASVQAAIQRGQDRTVALAPELTRLLSVRAEPGKDCETANRLAQSAWEDGQ